MRSFRIVVLRLLLVVACSSPLYSQAPSSATLFEGARLITGEGSAPIENSADAALLLTAGGGIALPGAGPGAEFRKDAAYGVTTEAEARKVVQDLARQKVNLVKLWVDDRDGTVPKLPPNLYRAMIDEAHKQKVRTIAHIFARDDRPWQGGVLPRARCEPAGRHQEHAADCERVPQR